MMKRKFEDVIAEQGKLIYPHVGDSMYPMIRSRDMLVIEAVTRPLQQYDIPLYRRDSGQYVLHRIAKIRDGEWLICGDNRCGFERGITEKNVIGVLTKIIRDGVEIPIDTPKYRLYARLLPFRRMAIRLKNRLP